MNARLSRFRQTIQIGLNITGIFRLKCVVRVLKDVDDTPCYVVNTGDGQRIAKTGDWLCEDYQGKWFVVDDEKKEQFRKGTYCQTRGC